MSKLRNLDITFSINSQDITASMNTLNPVGLEYEEIDVTAFSDAVQKVLAGRPNAPIDIGGPVNTDTNQAHDTVEPLNGDNTAYTVTIQFGDGAAPTTGDPEFEGSYKVTMYQINVDDMTWSARLVPGTTTAPAWGTVS